jgi:hypothetical protein
LPISQANFELIAFILSLFAHLHGRRQDGDDREHVLKTAAILRSLSQPIGRQYDVSNKSADFKTSTMLQVLRKSVETQRSDQLTETDDLLFQSVLPFLRSFTFSV